MNSCDVESYSEGLKTFDKESFLDFIRKCDEKYYKTIAMCYMESDVLCSDSIELGRYPCVFLCAISLEDPLREDIQDEIMQCKEAGINVVMLTGDKMVMAEHLAKKIGILSPSYLCISGAHLREYSDEELERVIHTIRVVARASPSDKKRFVDTLQKKGNIVAVTGDGTNDGLALKSADVGFGMGMSGTDIAKEASSVILLDDNFSSLVKSVLWGRCINNSVKKFIQFQLAVIITTVGIAIFDSLVSETDRSVFSPLKLLWINMIMDTFVALALSTDKPSPFLLKRAPEPKEAPIVTKSMKQFVVFSSLFTFATIGLLYRFGKSPSFIFNSFVFMQLFNEINARSLSPFQGPFLGLTRNSIFWGTNLMVILIQFVVMQHLGAMFKTKPLSLEGWISSVFWGFMIIPYFVVVRMGMRFKSTGSVGDWKKCFKYLSMELQLVEALQNIENELNL
jgi:Ca2+-transporting ATPase